MSQKDDDSGSLYEEALAEPSIEPSLEEQLKEVMELLTKALNNRFQEAVETCQKWSHCTLYHALGEATLSFLKGALTLERKEIDESMTTLKNVIEICHRKRRPINQVARVAAFIWRPNYNQFSEEEIHAELVYAEALLMQSLMTFLGDQNLINLVKGAFRIRSCYQSYKECAIILESRTTWSSEFTRRHFESGVRMGIGTFNLMISHMPNKVLKLLEFLGFSGNRATGFRELEAANAMTDSLRSPLAVLISLTYHCYVEHYFGLGEGDLDYVKELLDKTLQLYPLSAFFLMFAGRVAQLRCEIDEALEHFERCVAIQDQWPQLHNICRWESLFCHAIRCEWGEAAKFADLLRKKCAWSPATYTYQYATFLFMSLEDDENRKQEKKSIDDLIKTVPGLRIRYAGKTIPCEKFAIVKSEKYFEQPDAKLVLPAIEFLYIWNQWAVMDSAPHYAQNILDLVTEKLKLYEADKDDESKSLDHYAVCVFLKGMCLRTLGFPLQAEQCYREVIDCEKRLVVNTYLPPHAAMEIGLTYFRGDDFEQARIWLEKVRSSYSSFLLETVVHFRIHCAMRSMKLKEKCRGLSTQSSVDSVETGEEATEPEPPGTKVDASGQSSFAELARKYQNENAAGERDADLFGL